MVAQRDPKLDSEYEAPITFDEWIAMPADGRRTELIDGVIVVSPLAVRRHQLIQSRLGHAFLNAAEGIENAAVYFGVVVRTSNTTGVEPDLAVFTGAAGGVETDFGISGPPDLVVEILSPSNRHDDLITKAAKYAEMGVPEYWIVDPDKSVLIVGKLARDYYVRTILTSGTVKCEALQGAEITLDFLRP